MKNETPTRADYVRMLKAVLTGVDLFVNDIETSRGPEKI